LAWIVEIDPAARREFRKLDKSVQIEIVDYLRERIAVNQNPRRFGKPLLYEKHGL
jgi:mRNA interferase RelE/StbE